MTSHKNNFTFESCLFPVLRRQHLHVVNPQTQLWLPISEGRWWLNPITSSGTWFSSFASPISRKASKGLHKRKQVEKNRSCRRNIPISLEQKRLVASTLVVIHLIAVRYDREFLFWDISFISPFFYSIAVVCAGVSSRTTNKSKFYFLCVIARLFFKNKEIFWIAWALEDIFRYSLRHLFWINEITSFCQRNLLCDERKNRQGCLTLVLR